MSRFQTFAKILKPFINKYTLTVAGFVVLMSFGEYSLWNRFKLTSSVSELRKEKIRYEEEIKKAKEELKNLNTTKANLEKMAREKYLMHKENEEVFIIKKEEKE